MKLKLNAQTIAALDLPDGRNEEIFWAIDLPGFGLRLRRRTDAEGTVHTARTWICQWKRNRITRKMTLGNMPPVGVEAARKAAEKTLARVKLGDDPAAERDEDKNRKALRGLVDSYLAAKEPRLRLRTFVELRRYLVGEYFQALHNRPIDSIRRADVAACIVTIERKSGSPTAKAARGALSNFFGWAMQMGLAESNPTIGTIKPANSKPRERTLSDDELARVWRACDDGTEHSKIVRLLILTGARRQEIGGLLWSEIDLERGTLTISKARSKNHREHVLPLMPEMRSIVETCPRMVSHDHVFGARAADGFTNWTLPKPELDERSGVSDWTLHDLRRTAATGLANLGVQPHVVEALLNHQSGSKRGVAGVYNRSPYEREVRAALAAWHDHLRALVEGGERRVLNFQPQAAS